MAGSTMTSQAKNGARAKRALGLGCVLALSASLFGCDAIKFQGVVKTQRTTADGQVVTTEKHSDNFDDWVSDIGDATDEMAIATQEMIKTLTDVPPPGEIKLGELVPELSEFEDDPEVNLLLSAKTKDGKPYKFQYVRLGIPSYDEFFKNTAELHALLHLSRGTLQRSRALSKKVLGDDADDEKPAKLVHSAKAAAAVQNRPEAKQLEKTIRTAKATAGIASAIAQKTQALATTGQQLIAGAPSSITNPKVALHLDLIVGGLEQSVAMIGASAEHMGSIAGELADF